MSPQTCQVDHRHDLAEPGGAQQTASVHQDTGPGQIHPYCPRWCTPCILHAALCCCRYLAMSGCGKPGLTRRLQRRPRFLTATTFPLTPSGNCCSSGNKHGLYPEQECEVCVCVCVCAGAGALTAHWHRQGSTSVTSWGNGMQRESTLTWRPCGVRVHLAHLLSASCPWAPTQPTTLRHWPRSCVWSAMPSPWARVRRCMPADCCSRAWPQ